MDFADVVGPNLADGELVLWQTEARRGAGLLIVGGLLIRTSHRVMFLPKHTPRSLRRLRWSVAVADVSAVAGLRRWRLPLAGLTRRDRILIKTLGGNGLFLITHEGVEELSRQLNESV